MNSALHYKIYKEGINEQAISRHTKYIKSRHLYNLIKNHIWRA